MGAGSPIAVEATSQVAAPDSVYRAPFGRGTVPRLGDAWAAGVLESRRCLPAGEDRRAAAAGDGCPVRFHLPDRSAAAAGRCPPCGLGQLRLGARQVSADPPARLVAEGVLLSP